MRLTKSKLKQIIKEELVSALNEAGFGQGLPPDETIYGKRDVYLEEDDNPDDPYSPQSIASYAAEVEAGKAGGGQGQVYAGESSELQQEEQEEENNPWAICTAKVGREDEAKYERCVKSIKAQNKS